MQQSKETEMADEIKMTGCVAFSPRPGEACSATFYTAPPTKVSVPADVLRRVLDDAFSNATWLEQERGPDEFTRDRYADIETLRGML